MQVRELVADVDPGPQWHRARRDDVVLDAVEQLDEGAHAGQQQHVQMPALRHPGAGYRLVRQVVAVEHDDVVEELGQRRRRGEAADAGADHDGPVADGTVRHQTPPWLHLRSRGGDHAGGGQPRATNYGV